MRGVSVRHDWADIGCGWCISELYVGNMTVRCLYPNTEIEGSAMKEDSGPYYHSEYRSNGEFIIDGVEYPVSPRDIVKVVGAYKIQRAGDKAKAAKVRRAARTCKRK